jgi:hypothetical protein
VVKGDEMIAWILSRMFPPRISTLNRGGGMQESFDYLERISRKNLPKHKAGMMWGRIAAVREKRVICLPGKVI